MSTDEIAHAYTEGRISRRTLIRHLVAGGVSFAAAVSYAHLLAPDRAQAVTEGCGGLDEYPEVKMSVLSRELKTVIENKKLKVKVRPSEEPLLVGLRVTTRKDGQRHLLGRRTVELTSTEARKLAIPLDDVGPLRGRERARVTLTARRKDPGLGDQYPLCNPSGIMSVSAVLR